MSALPLITIGIPCFNAACTIERAVRSALAQDWSNKEILVVDDGSQDDSPSIVEKIAQENPAVRLVRMEKNSGVGAVRRRICEEARGDFIAFFDDDDVSFPRRVGVQYERIREYEKQTGEELIACYASGERLYPGGYKKQLVAIGCCPIVPHGPGVANRVLFFETRKGWSYGGGTPSCSLMARKSTIEKAGGFDPSMRRVEDLDFVVRLALAGGHFIGCPENLFIQHATEGSDKTAEKNLAAELNLVERNRDYLENLGMYEYARRWPLLRYYHFCGQHGRMMKELLAIVVRYPVRAMRHFVRSALLRFLHERKIRKGALV